MDGPEPEQETQDPAFMHHGAEAVPLIESSGVTARLIAGRAFGATSPLKASSETLYADVQMKAGATMPIDAGYDERVIYTMAACVRARRDAGDRPPVLQSHLLSRTRRCVVRDRHRPARLRDRRKRGRAGHAFHAAATIRTAPHRYRARAATYQGAGLDRRRSMLSKASSTIDYLSFCRHRRPIDVRANAPLAPHLTGRHGIQATKAKVGAADEEARRVAAWNKSGVWCNRRCMQSTDIRGRAAGGTPWTKTRLTSSAAGCGTFTPTWPARRLCQPEAHRSARRSASGKAGLSATRLSAILLQRPRGYGQPGRTTSHDVAVGCRGARLLTRPSLRPKPFTPAALTRMLARSRALCSHRSMPPPSRTRRGRQGDGIVALQCGQTYRSLAPPRKREC